MRDGQKTAFARVLRARMTDAEQRLWYRLRDRRLFGCKFRRQCPIGPYVVDFACLQRCLVVEIDGSQHLDSLADVRRDAFLAAEGFAVLRFWNNEVLANTETVCGEIARWLAERRPIPCRPPHGGIP